MIGLTHRDVAALGPCVEQFEAAAARLGDTWHDRAVTVPEALEAGVPVGNVLWVLQETKRDADTDRRYRLALADFAAHVLYIFERHAPKDSRPRDCIIKARAFARGEIGAADAARAARHAADAARAAWAADAARAAWAADAARAAWAADAARTAWAARAAWAAWAADAARTADAARAAWAVDAAERKWQGERLALWFSDDEPEDWPLPPKPEAQA